MPSVVSKAEKVSEDNEDLQPQAFEIENVAFEKSKQPRDQTRKVAKRWQLLSPSLQSARQHTHTNDAFG